MSDDRLKFILEAALLAAGRPLSIDEMMGLFEGSGAVPERARVRDALAELAADWQGRGAELKEVASGYRLQVRREFSPWLGRLWAERPPRYTRALLETLALIAYRQPITRGEIEDVRGVSVSPSIIKTLLERDWIRVLGHRDVPGRPEIFGTTRAFLDSFNLKSLDELPPLSEARDLDQVHADLFAGVDEPVPATAKPPASSEGEESSDADREDTHTASTAAE